jgi:AraC family transcriptional regulator
MEPRLVTLPDQRFVGLDVLLTPATMPEIPALWKRFLEQMGGIPGKAGTECYGLSRAGMDAPDGTPCLWYMAAVRVEEGSAVPHGMRDVVLPAGTYAVFTHEGHVSGIGATFDAAFSKWLPAAGLKPVPGPGYERYDDRYDGRTGTGPVDIYLPVEPRDGHPAG